MWEDGRVHAWLALDSLSRLVLDLLVVAEEGSLHVLLGDGLEATSDTADCRLVLRMLAVRQIGG